jgi:hypothetical protein
MPTALAKLGRELLSNLGQNCLKPAQQIRGGGMGKDTGPKEADRLHERASRATISAYHLGWIALIASIGMGIFGPSISAAVDRQTPAFVEWFAARWSLPWPIIVTLGFLCLLAGRWWALHEMATPGVVEVHPAPAPVADPAGPPAPEALSDNDRRILRFIALANMWLAQDYIAYETGIDGVALQASLLRLRNLRLVMRINQRAGVSWRLSDEGALYVDQYRAKIIDGPAH